MNNEVTVNKQGQALGRKGLESRAKLMDAACRLLETNSPVELTAVAIAAEAGTSPASFYMYFDDTKDILYALSEFAGQAMAEIHPIFDESWVGTDLTARAMKLVQSINKVWNEHRQILRFRNMEADRGDPRFEALRMNTYIPFIERFAQCILKLNPASETRRRADAYAEAAILHAAIERLAATEPDVMERGLGSKRVNANLSRMIALVLSGGQGTLASTVAPEHKTAAAAKKVAPTPAPAKKSVAKATAPKRAKAAA